MKFLCVLGLLTLPVLCFGQSAAPTTILPDVIGPSPNVAAIQEYGKLNVGTYSGVPEITIPLYAIKTRDYTFPISISYNASGSNGC